MAFLTISAFLSQSDQLTLKKIIQKPYLNMIFLILMQNSSWMKQRKH